MGRCSGSDALVSEGTLPAMCRWYIINATLLQVKVTNDVSTAHYQSTSSKMSWQHCFVEANGLELHTSLQVVNLTYSSALGDPGSAVSLHHSVLFCRDVSISNGWLVNQISLGTESIWIPISLYYCNVTGGQMVIFILHLTPQTSLCLLVTSRESFAAKERTGGFSKSRSNEHWTLTWGC